MKKYILGGISVLIMTAVAAWNVNLNLQGSDLSDISLKNIEASAGLFDDIENWWDSKVYTCIWSKCLVVVPYSYCSSGSTNAHCWECTECIGH